MIFPRLFSALSHQRLHPGRAAVGGCAAMACLLMLAAPAYAQFTAAPRITQAVNNAQRVILRGNTNPLARAEFDQGAVDGSLAMNRLLLVLRHSPAQQAALDQFLAAVQDPNSPTYHQWLTPRQFNARFGPAAQDVAAITQWLTSQGFVVAGLSAGGGDIEFSGTAAHVAAAFHTPIHNYFVQGERHWANATDPQIPAALAPVVAGVASFGNFFSRPMGQTASRPLLTTNSGVHALTPGDLATIYNVNPLYAEHIDGTGVKIAVVARSNVRLQDVQAFRSIFLPAHASNLPTVIVNGADPGVVSGEEDEADLDVQWAGAVAPAAQVEFVVSASTYATDGVDLSAEYIVNHDLAPILTMSFGQCEAAMASENQFIASLWQQAAAEGITVFVSSGDSGSATCDASSANAAQGGLAVNGLASTPYNVAVGGTEFDEGSDSSYWSGYNATGWASALKYIPEAVWNENVAITGNPGLSSGGGGVSIEYTKPTFQAGPGVPADGKRDLPDVSLTAAGGHDPYVTCSTAEPCTTNGTSLTGAGTVGGTSAAAPSFASLMALVVQATGSRQGQADNVFYRLAASQNLASCDSSGPPASSCVFNDVTAGSNAVPCLAGSANCTNGTLTGYSAGKGYDLASGLGSVNAFNLVTQWNSISDGLPTSITATAGDGQTQSVGAAIAIAPQVTVKDNAGDPVAGISVSFTTPTSGASATFASAATSATAITDASGVATAPALTANTTAGSYQITATAAGAGSVGFNATNTVGAAAKLTATSGSNQSAVVSTAFATNLQVLVADAYGNPVAGFPVTFTAPSSGASGTFAAAGASAVVTTDVNGHATAPALTANAIGGSYVVTATGAGVANVSFALANRTGADTLTLVAGDAQAAPTGTAFGVPLEVLVTSGGAPASFASVTFTAPASGASGTFANGSAAATVVAGADGLATATAFTAGPITGSYTVTVAADGGSPAPVFTLTNLALTGAATVANFPATPVGHSVTRTVTLSAGSSPIMITSVGIGANFKDFSISQSGSTCGGSLPAGASCVVAINFHPLAPGDRAAVLQLSTTPAAAFGSQTFGVAGVGTAPAVSFPPGVIGTLATGTATLSAPAGVVADDAGNRFVASGSAVELIQADGTAGAWVSAHCAGLALDAADDVFCADPGGNRVLEINASGQASTVAGTGAAGDGGDGGAAAAATLNRPVAVAVDRSGNVFIADQNNHVIRRVDASTGHISTIAGTGVNGTGGDGGAATSATLGLPSGLAVDDAGDLYIADSGAIREVNAASGVINTVASYTPAGGLTGMVIDNGGNLLVSGAENVLRVDAVSHAVTVIAGNSSTGYSGDGGPATSAALNGPAGLALDGAGHLLIADGGNNVIRSVSLTPAPALQFGATGVGSTSAPQTVALANAGNQPLTISSMQLNGDFAQLSASGVNCAVGAILPAGGQCVLAVAFQPSAAGAASGTLVIGDNALNDASASQTISLSGTAVAGSQTITFPAPTGAMYGATTHLAATASSGLSVAYTVSGPATVAGSTLTPTGAGAVTVTASQAGNSNWNAAAPVSQAFTIAGAPLQVTANNASMSFGAVVPVLSASFSGFVNGETAAVITGAAAVTTTATSTSHPGAYPIRVNAGTLAAANYTFSFVPGVMTVNQAAQTITFPAIPDQIFAATPLALAASATSGLPVSYTVVSGPAAVTGSSLTVTSIGAVTVEADQAGNTDYAAAAPVRQSFNVTAAPNVSVSLAPAQLDFEVQTVNTASPAQTLTLSNTGSAAVTIGSIMASGAFGETNTCGTTLATGASCSIAVTFTPTQAGTVKGTLTVNDSAAGSPHTVALTGAGSDLAMAPASGGATASTVTAGQAANFNLVLTPLQGLTGAFTLACSGAPTGASCTAKPSQVTLDGTTPQAVTLAVTTTARSLVPMAPGSPALPPWTLLLASAGVLSAWIVLPFGDVRRRRQRLVMAGLTGLLLASVACGGGGGGGGASSGGNQLSNPNATPAGKYTLQLTATGSDGATAAKMVLTLTVN